jgi:transcription initiation factor TFIIIB Brf1 subunit/transcription initiation factor TFIIB
MSTSLEQLKLQRECSYCGNKDLKSIIVASNGEIVCRKCGTVLGRISTPAQSEVTETTGDQGRESSCDGERTLEDHVSRYGWDL